MVHRRLQDKQQGSGTCATRVEKTVKQKIKRKWYGEEKTTQHEFENLQQGGDGCRSQLGNAPQARHPRSRVSPWCLRLPRPVSTIK